MNHIVKSPSTVNLSSQARTGERSAQAGMVMLATGALVIGLTLWRMVAGHLGAPTTAMAMLAGVLLLAAGVIAELDRRTNRTPGGHNKTGGHWRGPEWLIALAALLLIAALSYWFSTHGNFHETGTSPAIARARAMERAGAEFPHGFHVTDAHCERQQLDYACSISVEAN